MTISYHTEYDMASPVRELDFGAVEIYHEQTFGIGSYGKVCKAKYGHLPCAAKLLHDTMFQTIDPGIHKFVERFEQECQFLRMIKHPNIVQYLGTSRDPQSGRLTLLMELMDESLTKFLERSTIPLPYHTQLNICHDVALALAHLHSNDIIHRDLSSNNVLLIGEGSRAKVTDFGMSKLMDMNPRMTKLTMCPGTSAYMPPEALITPPRYSEKLDCFSHGVLAIQVITREFPNPGDAHKYDVSKAPNSKATRRSLQQIPESERRKKELDLVPSDHPLLPLALHCLEDIDTERPSAEEICGRLTTLKQEPQYTHSVEEISIQRLQKDLEEKDGVIANHTTTLQRTKSELEEALVAVNRVQEEGEKKLEKALADAEEKSQRILQARDSSIKQLLAESRNLVAAKEQYKTEARRKLKIEVTKKTKLKHELKASKKKLQDINTSLLALVGKEEGMDNQLSSESDDELPSADSSEESELLAKIQSLEDALLGREIALKAPHYRVQKTEIHAIQSTTLVKASYYGVQKTEIHAALQQRLKKGDTWYLVDVRWMKQWKKCVGYDQWDQSLAGTIPEPVDNSYLFKDSASGTLKEHLMEELDYYLLPESAWYKVTSWHGISEGSRPIPRKVVEHGLYMKHGKVEVYLLEFKLSLHSNPNEVITRQISRACSVAELEELLKVTFSVARDAECRVWHLNTNYELLDPGNSSQTVQDAGLYNGQAVVLEQKNQDGTWPKDTQVSSSPPTDPAPYNMPTLQYQSVIPVVPVSRKKRRYRKIPKENE